MRNHACVTSTGVPATPYLQYSLAGHMTHRMIVVGNPKNYVSYRLYVLQTLCLTVLFVFIHILL